jgi:hypothetical protein
LKRVSKKFWLCVSILACLSPAIRVHPAVRTPSAARQTATRANELTLAGLRPGRDTLDAARKLYGETGLRTDDSDPHTLTWTDPCRQRSLHIEADDNGVIQTIAVAQLHLRMPCRKEVFDKLRSDLWKTGHGIAPGDARARVLAAYGPPNSDGPSTGEGRELESLYYAFDWAGSDVPQVMQVYCDHDAGRALEITLAAPSL